MKLSLAMIVKNEAHNLGKCLESVKGLADEMVVLDTGSTDETAKIAAAQGATVEQFAWTGNFSEARNKALSLCTGDWILVLDADEMLDPREYPIIKEAILKQDAVGYRLIIKNYLNSGSFFGPGGSAKINNGDFEPAAPCSHFIPQDGLRLFRNQKAPLYSGRIHETVEPWFEQHGHKAPVINATIHHFGKIDTKRELTKQSMYLELAIQEVAANPNDPIAHGNVIQEALTLEDWPTVLESAQTFIKLKGSAPPLVHLAGAKALISTGRPEEAIEFLAPFDDQPTPDPAALELKAEALQLLGKVQDAMDACLQAIDADPSYTAPFIRISRLLDNEGDMENARKILEAGLDQNTKDLRLWEALVGLSSKHKDDRVAKDAWDAIRAVPNGGEGIWHLLLAHLLHGHANTKEAINVLDMGLVAFPGNTEIVELRGRLGEIAKHKIMNE
jgi:tetratricopeptide (TPR) repeat protein